MWPGCTRSPTAAPNLFSQPRRHALLQAVDPSAGLPKLTYFLREHFYFCLEHLHAGHRGTMLHLLNLDGSQVQIAGLSTSETDCCVERGAAG